jgi:hypothetical protein
MTVRHVMLQRMKSLLTIVGAILLVLNFNTVGAEPAAPETELLGEVRRVVAQGIVVKGTIEAPGETWEGTYVLIGYPKQGSVANGDTIRRHHTAHRWPKSCERANGRGHLESVPVRSHRFPLKSSLCKDHLANL